MIYRRHRTNEEAKAEIAKEKEELDTLFIEVRRRKKTANLPLEVDEAKLFKGAYNARLRAFWVKQKELNR